MKNLFLIVIGERIMNKKDLKNIWIVLLLFIIVIMITLNTKYSFGNTINYNKDLEILKLFKVNYLETKSLIPTFINDNGIYLNSFQFFQYGLVNPINILSYYINVNIEGYYSVISMIALGLSVILLYCFLFKGVYKF